MYLDVFGEFRVKFWKKRVMMTYCSSKSKEAPPHFCIAVWTRLNGLKVFMEIDGLAEVVLSLGHLVSPNTS